VKEGRWAWKVRTVKDGSNIIKEGGEGRKEGMEGKGGERKEGR
jgi:hypothetical protein